MDSEETGRFFLQAPEADAQGNGWMGANDLEAEDIHQKPEENELSSLIREISRKAHPQ